MGEAQISSKNPVINKQLQAKWRMELQFPRLEEGEGVDPAKGIRIPLITETLRLKQMLYIRMR